MVLSGNVVSRLTCTGSSGLGQFGSCVFVQVHHLFVAHLKTFTNSCKAPAGHSPAIIKHLSDPLEHLNEQG